MHRFVCQSRLEPGSEVILSPEDSHHLARVLRLEGGEPIALMDGKGGVAKAVVVNASPRETVARVETVERLATRSRVTVAFGIPKGPALEFIVRRLTELGVAAFQPLGTRYSLKAKEWNERRWSRVVVEVCKQCQEPWFPELLPALDLERWLASRVPSRALVFCDENRRLADADAVLKNAPGVDLLVGAEGGWSDEEREKVLAAGAISLGLGANRLRAETAALTAAVLAKQRLGEI